MFFARYFAAIRQKGVFRRLHSIREMRRVLQRERARADRSGAVFSLLSLSDRPWQTRRETLVELALILRTRLRVTDEAGWLDAHRIGIVLPDTPAWGAWVLADDLCCAFPDDVPLPECKVLSYPSDWSEEEQRWVGRSRRRRGEAFRPVEAMEPLFIRPLPAWKRSLDVIGAGLGLALLAPLMLLVAIAIRLTSPGPAVFAQMRSGLGGRPFRLYKFRSMVADAEQRKEELLELNQQDGPAFKLQGDPRITWLGRLLRATSVDELPQLWNCLKGDMSLVGPRPLPCDEATACRGWQRRRLDVTPGLTCIWQVQGRSKVSFADWVRMDLRYAAARSLWNDLAILARTVPSLLLRRGW